VAERRAAPTDRRAVVIERRAVMGMPVAITVRDRRVPRAVEAAFAWLRDVDERFSTYRPASEISRIARGELDPAAASPVVREVLARCEALREETGGAFDACAGGALDPSGLVKGWAVDRAGALLEEAGARDYCVDAGGDLRLRGGPWRVGVRHPLQPGKLAAVLTAHDLAIATSGTYERGVHILDPRTGRPPQGVLSVTVAGADLATADAYATAAFALGAAGPRFTAGLERHEAMTILEGGRVLTTPGFERLCGGATPAASLRAA
jgi:thiamine biosynthesis lipoprotein